MRKIKEAGASQIGCHSPQEQIFRQAAGKHPIGDNLKTENRIKLLKRYALFHAGLFILICRSCYQNGGN